MGLNDTLMRGKICLITGASRGIGLETAIGLAALGTHVVIVARDEGRGRAAVKRIQTAGSDQPVDLLLADLSIQDEVRRVAAEVSARYPQLDVLINNAGAVFSKRSLTVDGIEMTFALNHLSPFLLTHLLLPTLRAAPTARVITVSSDAHRSSVLDPDNLQGEKQYRSWGAYCQSKLENILFTYELARRLQGTTVTANCLHPGLVSTGFGKNNRGLLRLGLTLLGPFITQAKEGADTVIYLASSTDVAGVSGKYFVKRRAVDSSLISYDDVLAGWLWDRSMELVALARDPR